MSSRLRTSAATLFVAFLTASALTFTGGAAGAASKKKDDFRAPESHKIVDVDCKKVDKDTWKATFKWQVKGGRYQNLGNMENFKDKRDVVWSGGRRVVKTSVTIVPWGDGPVEAPESATATYNHIVAPVDDRSDWVSLSDREEVNLNCK